MARHLLKGIITPDEAAELASEVRYLDYSDPRLASIVGAIRDVFPINTMEPAYCRVESKPEGHHWHWDKGVNGHMDWCSYSASILLTPPDTFTGGGFYWRQAPDAPIFHFCDALVFNADKENVHCVARSSGERRALLMFFGEGGSDGGE